MTMSNQQMHNCFSNSGSRWSSRSGCGSDSSCLSSCISIILTTLPKHRFQQTIYYPYHYLVQEVFEGLAALNQTWFFQWQEVCHTLQHVYLKSQYYYLVSSLLPIIDEKLSYNDQESILCMPIEGTNSIPVLVFHLSVAILLFYDNLI